MATETELKLQRLVVTLDQFVNGDADTKIAIEGGRNVSTLAGIDKRAYKTKYVQKVIDYPTFEEAALDAAGGVLIDVGNVVRVFGETDATLNRLYQVQDDKTLLQIDYTDVYDLKNAYPAPYNHKVVKQSLSALREAATGHILSYTVQWSDVKAYNIFLTGKLKVSSHAASKEGAAMANFQMLVSLKGNDLTYTFKHLDPIKLTPDGSAFPADLPTLKAVKGINESVSNTVVLIKPEWSTSALLNSDPVMIEWTVDHIDKTPFY